MKIYQKKKTGQALYDKQRKNNGNNNDRSRIKTLRDDDKGKLFSFLVSFPKVVVGNLFLLLLYPYETTDPRQKHSGMTKGKKASY